MEPTVAGHVLLVSSAEQATGNFRCGLTYENLINNTEETIMSSSTDKIKGAANEAVGNVKQAAGKAVGNDRLTVEGALQERKGEAQHAVGKAKDAVKNVIDKV